MRSGRAALGGLCLGLWGLCLTASCGKSTRSHGAELGPPGEQTAGTNGAGDRAGTGGDFETGGAGGGSETGGAGAGSEIGGAGAGEPATGLGCVMRPVVSGNLTPSWAAALGNGHVGRMLVAPSGDIVVAGSFIDALHVDGQSFLASDGNHNNAFVLVLDPEGHVRWERTFKTNWTLTDIGADAAGDLFVVGTVGQFAERADLGLGPIADGIVVAKLDPKGATLWSRGAEGIAPKGADGGQIALGVSPAGELALLGSYSGTGSDDTFVTLLDPAGVVVWSKPVADYLVPAGATFDDAGNVVIGGSFQQRFMLGPTPVLTHYEEGFVATLDETGKLLSARTLGDATHVTALADVGGELFIGGSFGAALTLDGVHAEAVGLGDLFLATLPDASGTSSAAPKLVSFPSSGGDRLDALTPDGAGGVLALADLGAATDLGTGLLAPSSLVLYRVDVEGKVTSSAAFDFPYGGSGRSVALDHSGGIVTWGSFEGLADLGTGPLGGTRTFAQTMFVSRYAQTKPASSKPPAPCPPSVPGALLSSPSFKGDIRGLLLLGDSLTFWSDDTIWAMPVAGGVPQVLALAQRSITGLVANATSLVWTTEGTAPAFGPGGDGQVLAMPLGGGPITVLADRQERARAVALDGARVLWVAGGAQPDGAPADGHISSVLLAGGTPTELVTGLTDPGPVAGCAGTVVFTDTPAPAAQGDGVTTKLRALAQDKAVPELLASVDGRVSELKCNGTSLFWVGAGAFQAVDVSSTDGRISSLPLAGGTPALLTMGLAGPHDITPSGADLLWAERGGFVNATPLNTGGVWRMPQAGGTKTALVEHATLLGAFTADDSRIAFVEQRADDWALKLQTR